MSTWVEAVDENEVNDEKEKGVEGKFPILCLECSIQMPSSPPTEDDWYQVEMPLSNVVHELDEAGLDKLTGMRFKFTKTKRGSNFNIGHGQGTSKRTHQRREKSSMDLGEHAKNTKKITDKCCNAGRWMEILGFENRRLTKSYYTDGHEREDIVNIEMNIFFQEWLS